MILIKGTLLIILFLSSILLGKKLAGKYTNRTKELKEIKNAINILQTKIRYTHEPLPEIFKQIEEKVDEPITYIFKIAREHMKTKTANISWEQALQEYKSKTNLKIEDIKVLQGLGKLLGQTDIEGQISQIELTLNFLEEQIQNSTQEQQKNEKMYKSLGVITGLALVIILI